MALWEDVEIVTLAQAKKHLRITVDEENQDLADKLADAHALVLDHVSNGRDDDFMAEMETWDDESAPRPVRAAILRTFGDLVRFRGNDDDPAETRVAPTSSLSPRAKQLLSRYHDPSLA